MGGSKGVCEYESSDESLLAIRTAPVESARESQIPNEKPQTGNDRAEKPVESEAPEYATAAYQNMQWRMSKAEMRCAELAAENEKLKKSVESEAVALREVEGPQPLPARYSCFGCKHLLEERWREPSGDGETFDSGDSATCMAITTEHGGKNISAYWGRNNPPPTWCPKPLRSPAADPTGEA